MEQEPRNFLNKWQNKLNNFFSERTDGIETQ